MSLIGVLASLEKTIPMGWLHMRPFQWYLKTNWQYPQSLDLKIPVSNFLKSHLQWWEDPKNLKNGLSFSSTGTQYPYFHKCINSRLGSSFWKHDSQWQLDRSGEITSYQCPRVKGSVSGLKKLSKQNSRQKGSHSNRQRHCSQLSEQTRGNTLMGHVSPGLAHLGLLQSSKHTHKSQTHSGLPQCHSRQSLQEGQNNSNRMVTSSSNIQSNLHSLAQTNVCYQIESQTTNLCLTSPRCKCCEHRCFEHLLGGSGQLCLLSCNSHTKGHTENEHLQVQNDSSSTRVAQNALVSSESVNQAPLQLPHWPHLLKQPFSQKFHQNLMYLNMHVWHLDTTQNHLNHSLSRWQIEFWHLKDPHLEDSRSQGGPFLNSGANRTRWSAQSLLSQT